VKLRARTSAVGTITASLAFALVGPAVAAHASAEASSAVTGAALVRFPEFAGLKDSKSLTDPLMLQGKLTDATGKALGGAQVLLAAWPSAETVGKLPAGGSFDIVPVARTVAGKDGAYQLRSLITPLLLSLAGKDGLDVELDVFHGSRHYVYLTQLSSEGNGSWAHDFVRGVDGQAGDVASAATNGLDLALDPAQGEKLSKGLSEGGRFQAASHPQPGGIGCTHYERVDDPNRPVTAWTTLVSAVARNGTALNTTYSKGARTATSTGFSFDQGATFSVSGARERSADVEAVFRSQHSKHGNVITRSYQGRVQHVVLHRECTSDKYGEYRQQYVTSPAGLTGAFRVVEDSSRAPVACNPKYKQELGEVDHISTENAKAYTYERAFSFAPIAGGVFTGNALSGYSEQVKVTFAFAGNNAGWCGVTAGPLAPGQIVQGYDA